MQSRCSPSPSSRHFTGEFEFGNLPFENTSPFSYVFFLSFAFLIAVENGSDTLIKNDLASAGSQKNKLVMIYPNDSKIPSKYRDIGRDMIEFESLRMKQNEEKNIWDVQAKLDEIINRI